ncbi:MAG TPA: type I methionyl aminopeptidase [Longimicrobiales bacterium]|nr:type I methionyl aminopeptidase [Longimicrobiales bacterium]
MIHLRTAREIEAIGEGGSIIGRLFEHLETVVAPGVSTQRLDEEVEEFVVSHDGAVPAFKGLYGFPGAACISVNEEIVHGIPKDSVTLGEGDIVTVDVGVRLDGWCSDSAWTFAVGDVDADTQRLLDATRGALDAAIEAAVEGNHVGDLGAAVMKSVEGQGIGIVRDLVGHGIGREVHEEPQIPNVGRPGHGPKLRNGMVLAIEPMLSLGTDRIRTLEDRWTVVTQDGSRSAHFEHTVAVTEEGPRILTGSHKESPHPV